VTEHATRLLDRIARREARVGVIGLGYVGLPLLRRFFDAGFPVTGFDIDADKISSLRRRASYFSHIADASLPDPASERFAVTTDFSVAGECDALILCVPTPLAEGREPDLGYVIATMESLRPYFHSGQLVSLESTTYPGTTDEEIVSRLVAAGLVPGVDCFVVFSPEREDPGNPAYGTHNIPKVIGGHTAACLAVGEALYGAAIDRLVPVSSTQAAEMTKLLENIFRAVNIGLVNEMKTVADAMGIDIHEVIAAAATKPFGFMPFLPGPGLGGHCIPIDPFYLTWKARQVGVETRFIELAGEVNTAMPGWVIGKLEQALLQRGVALEGASILVLGAAYKKNISDVRESPAVVIIDELVGRGAIVSYSDPYVPRIPRMRRFDLDLASVALTPELLASQDAVILVTDHDAFDYDAIGEHARLIVDTRNRFAAGSDNVVPA